MLFSIQIKSWVLLYLRFLRVEFGVFLLYSEHLHVFGYDKQNCYHTTHQKKNEKRERERGGGGGGGGGA